MVDEAKHRDRWGSYPDEVRWQLLAEDLDEMDKKASEAREYLRDIKVRVTGALIGLVASLSLLVLNQATKR